MDDNKNEITNIDRQEPEKEFSREQLPSSFHQIGEFEPEKENKKIKISPKKILLALVGILILYIVYSVLNIYVSPDRNIQQIYLVPEDAAFIIQSSDPVEDWKKFSNSDTWQCLKKAKSIEEISKQIESFDSIIQHNRTLLSLVGKRDLIVSIHKTRSNDWDFLIMLDMQKTSKLKLLKDQIENILKLADQTVTHRTFDDIDILEIRDPETRDILYAAFVENHFVASYTSKLLESSIMARHKPVIGLETNFIEAEKMVSGKGLARMYINYFSLQSFMSIYLGGENEYMDILTKSMDFAGLYFNTHKDRIEMKGYTFPKENTDPYVIALLNSGKQKMRAHEVMSARTAFYTHIGINDPSAFAKELENVLSANNQNLYNSYLNSRKKIENLFDISLDEHFLSWMSGEFALSQSEPGLLGREPELILAIRTKNIKKARQNMELIEKKIKNKTPVRIKTVTYKDYDINYIELKGFFRLFFGGLFDKFEKPYYTYIDDYVIFSNQSASLLSFIEDYEQKNLLKNDPGFKKAYDHFSSNSTIFLYADIHKFYPQLLEKLNTGTKAEMQSNKDVIYSFPYWSTQFLGEGQSASLHYVMDYIPYTPETAVIIDPDKDDKILDEDADTERKQMSELKRFYVEKFQGNILREFHPEGTLKSESEIKDGKRHGRYREYYEDGTLKVRGKYVNNYPKGTWKYYTEEGKFDRKQKF